VLEDRGVLVFDQPTIATRERQAYLAVATKVTMEGFDVVEGLTDEVFAWLSHHGVAPSGPPFVRIVTSDMTAELDIEVGVLVDDPPAGDDRFIIGAVPAGSYATLIYTLTDENDHYQSNVEIRPTRDWNGTSIATAAPTSGWGASSSSARTGRAMTHRSSN
jgi:hypothetical protein